MAFDSQKRILAVLNTRSILLLDGSTGNELAEVASKPTSYAGIAFRPGNRELWASEASRNGPDSILIAQISELGMPGATSRIDLKGHPVPVGIAFSPDGKTAYVAFSRSNTLAVIDATTHEIVKESGSRHGAVRRGGVQRAWPDLRHQSRRPPPAPRTTPWRPPAAPRSLPTRSPGPPSRAPSA